MRFLAVLVLPVALAAQTAETADQRLIQSLVSEIQQLRLAIERSTLLNARTQLAVMRLQMEESAAERVSSQLGEVRSQGTPGRASHLASAVQSIQEKRSGTTEPRERKELEDLAATLQFQAEEEAAKEAQRSAREAELASQLQAAQAQVTDSRNRIADLERALDAAIQQLVRQK